MALFRPVTVSGDGVVINCECDDYLISALTSSFVCSRSLGWLRISWLLLWSDDIHLHFQECFFLVALIAFVSLAPKDTTGCITTIIISGWP